jgi:hypothetical protein
VIAFIFHASMHAQEWGVQISPGLMNYGGDLQTKAYTFQQAHLSISAGLIYTIQKFSIRGDFTFGKVEGNDANNTKYKYRNLSFYSNISDVNLILQYDILSLDNRKFTPYVFAGLGVFHFNPYAYYDSQKVYLQPLGTEGQGLSIYPDRKMYSLTRPEIPYGIGFKYKLTDNILLGFEFRGRYLFTDYLDDVSKTYPDENELFKQRGQLAVDLSYRGNQLDPTRPFPSNGQRGNQGHNDIYYTSSFTFTYIFPERSSYSTGGGDKKSRKNLHLDCPKHLY